ncbi:MAG: Sir2 family NAD-dependent protein deacetylase [Nitrospiraceae bacterium]|jgi:NAD-dependent deacetylase|nr:MAG: Sir2 family NAD-dependent protein deacetylase [Nitrospiraceae bacterium]
MQAYDERIAGTVRFIREATHITAFTGAGISTESGIKDFRSPGGIWDRYRIVTFQEFVSDHKARVEYWNMRRELFHELNSARPNRAHKALAALEQMGRLQCLITQNIDGLHYDAGNADIIELHGTNKRAACLSCGKSWPIADIQARLEAGERAPTCDDCNGLIKPATVSFGQAMPEKELMKAAECASSCDLFLMIGSSLKVEPAASIPKMAYQAGAKLVFVNRTETPLDTVASIIFREDAGDVLSRVIERLHS